MLTNMQKSTRAADVIIRCLCAFLFAVDRRVSLLFPKQQVEVKADEMAFNLFCR